MTVPKTEFTQIDNALGVTSAAGGLTFAVIGPCVTGATGFGGSFTRKTDLVTSYTGGPGVELASYLIAKTGKPVLFVRSETASAGSTNAINDDDFTGTASVTAYGVARDELETKVKFSVGGTAGNSGIKYQYSLDNGRSYSAVRELPATGLISITEAGVTYGFTGGTIVAGDIVSATTNAPKENSSTITSALTSLSESNADWDIAVFATPVDSNTFSAIDTFMTSMWNAGRPKAFIASTESQTASDATYQSHLNTEFSSSSSIYGSLVAGYTKARSAVTGYGSRRPGAYAYAARAGIIDSVSTSLAQVSLGPLPSDVQIRDANGVPDEHDEQQNPGLDDLRFACFRSFPSRTGVYINRPLTFAPVGSDYWRFDYRLVINKFREILQAYFDSLLESPLRVSARTGYLLAEEVARLNAGAEKAAKSVLMTKPDVSDLSVVVSSTDNVLSTGTIHVSARIVPLAYPDNFGIEIGFSNPANVIGV